MVNAFAILGDEGVVLVDAGLPNSVPAFARALERCGRSLGDVRLIAVTHGHVDHAGGASALREATRAPIVAHRAELPFLRGEAPMTFLSDRVVRARVPRHGGAAGAVSELRARPRPRRRRARPEAVRRLGRAGADAGPHPGIDLGVAVERRRDSSAT